MRYFLDTEFIENGHQYPIDLISLGIVAQDGRELYAQVLNHRYAVGKSAALWTPNDFVARHVLPHLDHFDMGFRGRACVPHGRSCSLIAYGIDTLCPWVQRSDLADTLREFCDPQKYEKPEFWGYYSDYDWVVFCQIFGAMIDLPGGWPMYCRDIKQWADELGNPTLPQQTSTKHHALSDARWTADAYAYLATYSRVGEGASKVWLYPS